MALDHSWLTLVGGDRHGHQVQVPNSWIEEDEAPKEIEVSSSRLKWTLSTLTISGVGEDSRTVLTPTDWSMHQVMKHLLEPRS
jgi:hypothetical protein